MNKDDLNTHNKIKRYCCDLRYNKGMRPADITKHLQEIGIDGYSRSRVNGITRADKCKTYLSESVNDAVGTKEQSKEGATERKPKYTVADGFYTIYYGKNKSIRASKEDIEKAFKLFCLGKLTMNQTALTMGWTRAEFFAIKTALDITKDSIPLLPETIDELDSDEIAETIRIEKKRLALQKFSQGKSVDLEKENKKFQELSYWFNLLSDKLDKIEPEIFKPVKAVEFDGIERIVSICDIHAGERISSSRWGSFSLDIMRNRFKELATQIMNKTKPCKLHIFSGGDLLAGRIKESIIKMSDNFVDSLCAVTECMINLIGTLIMNGYQISLIPILGNHGAIESDKTARTLADNYERIITWAIKLKLANIANFEIIEPEFNMGLIKLHDYSIICVHGDNGSTKQLADLERLFRRERVREILAGHVHHQKSEEYCGVTVYHQPSFIGAEHYGLSKGLLSEPGCRLIEYGKQGRLCEHYLRFSE